MEWIWENQPLWCDVSPLGSHLRLSSLDQVAPLGGSLSFPHLSPSQLWPPCVIRVAFLVRLPLQLGSFSHSHSLFPVPPQLSLHSELLAPNPSSLIELEVHNSNLFLPALLLCSQPLEECQGHQEA